MSLHKSFPLRISSVNVTKSAGNLTEEILNAELHFLCGVLFENTELMWKSKTLVTSCELRVQIYELRVQFRELLGQIHQLRVQIHELGS